jgi:hypothetical protein
MFQKKFSWKGKLFFVRRAAFPNQFSARELANVHDVLLSYT